jgi:hypothetical protein
MRPLVYLLVLACPLAAAALATGCGSGGSTTSSSSGPRVASLPAPPMSDFPSAQGKTFGEIVEGANHSEYSVEPRATAFYEGGNRYPFSVFERAGHAQVNDAEVALYFAPVPTLHPKNTKYLKSEQTHAKLRAMEEPALGPFPASIESLETKTAFRSAATAADPEAARAIYASQVELPADGEWRVAALIREGGEYGVSVLPDAIVGEFHRIPRPGEPAPLIHTPSEGRNRIDYADAYGRRPIMLLFTTPEFCQSRVCGPVVDAAEQVKQRYGDKAAFIQMEIYNDNDPAKNVRPQVAAFHLPTEPWLFAIDRNGVVKKTLEGGFGVAEMTRAAKAVTSE